MANHEQETTFAPRDSTYVDLRSPAEVKYWSEHFGVFPHELQLAVETVGHGVKDVEFYLQNPFVDF